MIPPEPRLDSSAALEVAARLLGSPDADTRCFGEELQALAKRSDSVAPTPEAGADAGHPAAADAPR